jgi:hypothetical protein
MRRSLPGPLAAALRLIPLTASAQTGRVQAGTAGLAGVSARSAAPQRLRAQSQLELRPGR